LSLVLVIEKGRGAPTVYSDGSIDITDQVIREFKQTTP
jgi:Skp family chaperone for outer membrane proteins